MGRYVVKFRLPGSETEHTTRGSFIFKFTARDMLKRVIRKKLHGDYTFWFIYDTKTQQTVL